MQRGSGGEARRALALVWILIAIGFILLFSFKQNPVSGGISINTLLIFYGILLAAIVYFILTFPFYKDKIFFRVRFCVACGRNIPFDSVICPYCRYDYEKINIK